MFKIARALVMAAAAAACAGVAPPSAAGSELANALNAVRARGCDGRSGVASVLRENAQLAEAAKRASGRLAYQDALAAAGYRATRSALIQLSSDPGAPSVANLVARHYCAMLVEPDFREIGIYQQRRESWIILAAPFSPPGAEASKAVAERVLDLVNQARTQARVCGSKRFAATGMLSLNATLSGTSLAHAADMARYSYFSHEGRDGSTVEDRVTRAGYRWRSIGENIASGASSPEVVVNDWIRSPPHCANLMDPRFAEMGVAYAVNRASQAGIYWVQLFGTPR